MGSVCSKAFEKTLDAELEEIKECLAILLKQLSPDELLTFATEDTEIYEICKDRADLRQTCILAAVRRYHTEKFFFEEVHNRTADYVVMLDNFIQIQDDADRKEMEEDDVKCCTWCVFPARDRDRDREGDAAANGEGTST